MAFRPGIIGSTFLLCCSFFLSFGISACDTGLADTNSGDLGGLIPPNTFPVDFPINIPDINTAEVALAAGMSEIEPETQDTITSQVSSARLASLGITGFDQVYKLTTPLQSGFSFSAVGTSFGNIGRTELQIAHIEAGGQVPTFGAESIAVEGVMLDGPGLVYEGEWIRIIGDGFARLDLRGEIEQEQVFAIRAPNQNGGFFTIGVRMQLAAFPSAINLEPIAVEDEILTETCIYSSDSWHFGLPAIAVSGDRYSVVTYDGNPDNPNSYDRKRRWLQYEPATGDVSGGEATSASFDTGFWRDQEIASRGNVLGIVYTGDGVVRLDLSLDRGASFPILHYVDESNGFSSWGERLVQVEIASDYTLGILYWAQRGDFTQPKSQLLLVEAFPQGFDSNNTPTSYLFSDPKVIYEQTVFVTPTIMDLEYSDAGDLVIGYGCTYSRTPPGVISVVRENTSEFRCFIRSAGSSQGNDILIDSEREIVPNDPSVALWGSGPDLEIFYAYEKSDGVHLMHRQNAGTSFTEVASGGRAGSFMPSVHLREQNGLRRLDVLYLSPEIWGTELHSLHWDDFDSGSAPRVLRLTQAEELPGCTPPAGMPQLSCARGIGSFGYDAVTDGDDVAIVIHEQRIDMYDALSRLTNIVFGNRGGFGFALAGSSAEAFDAASAPILLPGMTGSVATPNPDHRNKLKILELD